MNGLFIGTVILQLLFRNEGYWEILIYSILLCIWFLTAKLLNQKFGKAQVKYLVKS